MKSDYFHTGISAIDAINKGEIGSIWLVVLVYIFFSCDISYDVYLIRHLTTKEERMPHVNIDPASG
jgi:hypothetical protein